MRQTATTPLPAARSLSPEEGPMSKTHAAAAAELDALVEERVDLALSNPDVRAQLAQRGISLQEARAQLVAYTQRSLDLPLA